MIRIQHRGRSEWAIWSSGYSQVLRESCKETPGMTWNATARAWCGYADAVAVAADKARARGLLIQGDIETNGIVTLPISEKDARPYQVEGIHFLVAKAQEGCILADEMAMGKSVQAIRAARAFKCKTVIVCPSFVRGVWADELERWWPDATVAALSGTKPNGESLPAVDVVVIHYDILHAWVPVLIAWGLKTLILDEIQYCQSGKSRRTQACVLLARSASYRMGLTGTPPTEKIKNLWAAVDVLSEGRFGKPFGFLLRYCDGKQEQVTPTKTVWKFDGSSHLDELQSRMMYSPATPWGFMLRRLKSEVALQLPARTRQMLELEVPRLGSGAGAIVSALRNEKLLRAALNATADGKIPQVVELIVDHIQAGHKVVVGSYRKAIAIEIAEGVGQKLPAVVRVCTGDVPQAKRDAMIREQPNLLACTFDSTSVGIDLSFASVGVVAELDYSPTKLLQWEARFGRKAGRNVLIQYAIARGSADDLVKQLILLKLDRFTNSIGKVDGKLKEDLAGIDGPNGVDRLRLLYERMMADD